MTYLALTEGGETVSPVAEGPALVFESASASFGSMYHLGPDYQDARRSLAVKVDEEMSRLSPEERAEVQKKIDVIRAASEDINKALAAEPDNELLQKLLLLSFSLFISWLLGC